MNYIKKMFSSSNEVSWGRGMATIVLVWAMLTSSYIMYHMKDPVWVDIPEGWKILAIALFGISKAGETTQKFAKKENTDASAGNP